MGLNSVENEQNNFPASQFFYDADGYLSLEQLADLYSTLSEQEDDLSKRQRVLDEKLKGLEGVYSDPVDEAQRQDEVSSTISSRDREMRSLRSNRAALAMMKKDEFGYCLACGSEIGFKRLKANPTATKCIDCKSVEELKCRT